MSQKVYFTSEEYPELDRWITQHSFSKIMLVCGKSIRYLKIKKYLEQLEKQNRIEFIVFSDFEPNPLYTSVIKGIKIFTEEKCEGILAIGGGSAMDVAKCIKLYAGSETPEHFLDQKPSKDKVPLFAVPTTAGSGSEATRFAVVYKEGIKQSISDEGCIPEAVILDHSVLNSLPLTQKKSTMMDAFCHSLESMWSINSTSESIKYASEAITEILLYKKAYLNNDDNGNMHMLYAANLAGRAINISQTTAGHAMCYKITSLFGIPHGQAAAMCVRKLFPWMLEHLDHCVDPRGQEYLKEVFSNVADIMHCKTSRDAADYFERIFYELEFSIPSPTEKELELLVSSVNQTRLSNNPIALDKEDIMCLYRYIFEKQSGKGI